MATAETILTLARGELGYRESPANSNRTKYGKWFKLDGNPWCMMFVMWIFHKAEASALLPNQTASCGAFMKAAKKADNWHKNSDLQPGDVVIFDFPGNSSRTDHTGIVEEIGENSYVYTIEGNTGKGNDANGGMVMRRKRKRSLIVGAFRPAYAAEAAEAPEEEPQTEEPSYSFEQTGVPEEEGLPKVGDFVTFKGPSQFSSPYDDAEAVPATACTARVDASCPGTAHPFRLYGTGVEGWADLESVELMPPEAVQDAQESGETEALSPGEAAFSVKITARPSLKTRSGPGTEYSSTGSLSTGTVATILEERGGWGRIPGDAWISLKYTSRIE